MKHSADLPVRSAEPPDVGSDQAQRARVSPGRAARPPATPEDILIPARVSEFAKRMGRAPPGLAKDAQIVAGRIALALPGIAEERATHLLDILDVAVSALLRDPPNINLAKRILDGVERQLLLRRKIRYLIMGLGLGLLLTLALTVAAFLTPSSAGFDPDELGLVSLAGFVGAAVSLAIKIKDYSRLTDVDTRVLLYTGFFKPLIGMAFALFIYMVLSSGIIEMGVAADKARFFFVAVAFVAGFSERFAKDVISKVEQTARLEESERPTADQSKTYV
jgi:hypothetical protein